ncbi:hypothetical protein JS530_08065 [Bifidobacterium sp. LC6]|uniref:EbhA n=1 Tax=Bifidobacterium colobi TaxID=2809026 RepID=A0ABS5UXC9_9BIFI|nr:hypothetical protein [Bifidobacterium colobi]MBT1175448.1 hypothetical protein [Bifidobacterium colobi]
MSSTTKADAPKTVNRKTVIAVVIAVVVALVIGIGCYVKFAWMPHDAASKAYDAAVSKVEKANTAFDKVISSADKSVKGVKKNKPLDNQIVADLKAAIAAAQKERVQVGEKPSKTDELNAAAAKYATPPDYSKTVAKLEDAQKKLADSQKQYQQVDAPKDDFIVQRLTGLPDIDGIQAATEDNDPNENLNKKGGYVAAVFFCSPLVDQSFMEGSVLDKGTDCGGSVESYTSEEDAAKRDKYLSAFDGQGFLDSGSHEVIGTVVVRTSTKLNAAQQKTMADNIKNALTRLE